MTDSQQARPLTVDEQFKMLFDRTAKLNDALSALMAPEWGAQAGLLPVTHPLHPDMRHAHRPEIETADRTTAPDTAEDPTTGPERQAAYEAVYAYIRLLGDEMPGSKIHRNAIIWQGVAAALDAFAGPLADAEQHKQDYLKACGTIAAMHAAATGRTGEGPIRGVVEDVEDVRLRAEQAEQERDGAYRERAHLVALIAAMTDGAVIVPALDLEEAGWWIVYLNLGGRQASWHISPRDAGLLAAVEHVDIDDPRAQWDGHTTEEKYAGIAAHTAELMQDCGPECAEMHRGGHRCTAGRS